MALTLIEQALETCPDSQELLETADRLRSRRRAEERRKKLARRLETVQQKIGAEAWTEALALIAAAQAEFPGEPELERRLEQARAGRRRAECDAIAAEARQYLTDGEPERRKRYCGRAWNPAGRARAGRASGRAGGRQTLSGAMPRLRHFSCAASSAKAENILFLLAAQNRPDAQALLEAVRAARAASEEDDFFDHAREQGLKLIAQHQFEQAADLIRNLLTLFPGDPILKRDLQTAEAGLQTVDASACKPAALSAAAAGRTAAEAGLQTVDASACKPAALPAATVGPTAARPVCRPVTRLPASRLHYPLPPPDVQRLRPVCRPLTRVPVSRLHYPLPPSDLQRLRPVCRPVTRLPASRLHYPLPPPDL